MALIKQFGFMWSMAFIMASPIICALLAIDLCSALINRSMPQINMYFLTTPLKILFGVVLLMNLLPYLTGLTDRIMSQCFHTWMEYLS